MAKATALPTNNNQASALLSVLGDGNERSLPELASAVAAVTGNEPKTSSLYTVISGLRKQGYQIVTNGKRPSTYKLAGAKGRRKANKKTKTA